MGGEQFFDCNAERHSEALDVVDRDIPDFAFNVSHECAMQPGLERKLLLRPPLRRTKRTDVGSQNGTGARRCCRQVSSGGVESRRIITALTRLSQPRISHNLHCDLYTSTNEAAYELVKPLVQERTSNMPPSIPLSPEGSGDSRFLGVSEELCFVATWLPRGHHGYASLLAKEFNRLESAHRLVLKLLIGTPDIDEMVLHRCGNSQCHNPYHLYVGGVAENHRDKILHREARRRFEPLVAPDGSRPSRVLTPRPLVLSREVSRLAARFAGFSPDECFHADWLHQTFDGYRQLCRTTSSGEVVGAHRKIYALFNGPLGRYDIVSHRCADRTCLNPYHLLITGEHTSRRDFNARHDRRCKITDAGLAMIADPTQSAAELAKNLGLHPQTIMSYRRELLGATGHTR